MTTLNQVSGILRELKPELMRKFYVKEIGLFGSIVRDDFTTNSDIDILVDFSRPVGIEFIDLADYLEARLEHHVDLVSRGGIKEKYFGAIQADIIYV